MLTWSLPLSQSHKIWLWIITTWVRLSLMYTVNNYTQPGYNKAGQKTNVNTKSSSEWPVRQYRFGNLLDAAHTHKVVKTKLQQPANKNNLCQLFLAPNIIHEFIPFLKPSLISNVTVAVLGSTITDSIKKPSAGYFKHWGETKHT